MLEKLTLTTPMSYIVILPFLMVAAVLAYWCSRGADGKLVESLIGFSLLALLYVVVFCFITKASFSVILIHFLLLEVAVIAALRIKPELQEMAGMLNYFIPFYVFLISSLAAIVKACVIFFGSNSQ